MLAQGRYPVARCWTRIYASFTGQIAAVVELEWCECGLGQAVGRFLIFVERSTPKIGALVPKRRVRTALAHKPGQTRPQESGILRNVTYRQDIRGDFVFFKTLTRRRNPVSQLAMRVGVQNFCRQTQNITHFPLFLACCCWAAQHEKERKKNNG